MFEDIKTKENNKLIDAVIEGIRRKKGEEIIDLNLTSLGYTECDHFIICHGNSNVQVEAIARSVEETVEEITSESAWHIDGYKNGQWILLDFAAVIVHVFQKDIRAHYDLENLWADANVSFIKSEN